MCVNHWGKLYLWPLKTLFPLICSSNLTGLIPGLWHSLTCWGPSVKKKMDKTVPILTEKNMLHWKCEFLQHWMQMDQLRQLMHNVCINNIHRNNRCGLPVRLVETRDVPEDATVPCSTVWINAFFVCDHAGSGFILDPSPAPHPQSPLLLMHICFSLSLSVCRALSSSFRAKKEKKKKIHQKITTYF